MKGHLERSRSLKSLNEKDKEHERIPNELKEKSNSNRINITNRSPSPSVTRLTPPFSPDTFRNERKYQHHENDYHEYNEKENNQTTKHNSFRSRNSNEIPSRKRNQKRTTRNKEVEFSSGEDYNRDLSEKENKVSKQTKQSSNLISVKHFPIPI